MAPANTAKTLAVRHTSFEINTSVETHIDVETLVEDVISTIENYVEFNGELPRVIELDVESFLEVDN